MRQIALSASSLTAIKFSFGFTSVYEGDYQIVHFGISWHKWISNLYSLFIHSLTSSHTFYMYICVYLTSVM